GPGNTLWVSLETTNEIARITGVEPEAPAAPPAPPPPNTPIVVMPVPGDTTAPRLTGLRVRPARFRVGREGRARTRADARAARLPGLGLRPARFRVGRERRARARVDVRPARPGRRARRRPAPRGPTTRFTLSEPATVRFDVERARAGRRRGGSCVAPSRRLR